MMLTHHGALDKLKLFHLKDGGFNHQRDYKMNLEHTRHRSPINAFVHILSTFISYCFKKNKPSINYGFDLSLNYALIPN